MDEDDRPVERETTVINTGGGGGGGGTIAAVLVVLVLAVLAFVYFGGYLDRAADGVNVNVDVDAPEIKLPDVTIEQPAAPPAREEPAQPPAENKQ